MSLMSELGDLQISKLRPYSIGIVAENKKIGTHLIQVTPLENVSFMDGEVAAKLATAAAAGVDANGASYSASTNTSAAITATWLALNDANRLTSPDVRRGDPVQIWQFADEDKYWWTCLTADNSRRRLETIVYGVSNSTVEDEPLSNKNMYWWEISTHRKVIHLGTSKSQGEPFRYDLQIDCGNGQVAIMDDAGNYICMNSPDRRIELKNADGSHYDMRGKNLTVTIPETVAMTMKNWTVDAEQTITIKAGMSYRVDAPRINQEGSTSATYSAPETMVSGSNVDVQGSSSTNVFGGGSATLTSGGSAEVSSPDTVIF